MRPGEGDLRVDRMLTNMSIGYRNPLYIARLIFPVVLVNDQAGIVPRYDQSPFFRLEAKKLGITEAPPRGGFTVDTTLKYFTEEYGIGIEVADRTRANAQSPFDADRDSMMWLVDQLDKIREDDFVTNFWKAGVWGTDWTGGSTFTKWSDYSTSTPIVNVRVAKRTVRRKIAMNPNILVLGDMTFDVLCDHPVILDRIKYGASSAAPAMVEENLLAQLWALDSVLVGTSIYTADAEGTAEGSVTYSPYWDDDAMLLYRPTRPSLMTPASGYNFVWRTVWGGERFIRRRREPLAEKSDLLEGFEFFHQLVTASRAGLFMSDCVD